MVFFGFLPFPHLQCLVGQKHVAKPLDPFENNRNKFLLDPSPGIQEVFNVPWGPTAGSLDVPAPDMPRGFNTLGGPLLATRLAGAMTCKS